MKHIITTIYTTIFSILLVTVFFTIAELTTIAKTEFVNQLQQSVVMNASYLIACKLIIQIVLTYIFGHMIYHKIGYDEISRQLDEVLKKEATVHKVIFKDDIPLSSLAKDRDTNNIEGVANPLWSKYPERMMFWRERLLNMRDTPMTPDEAIKGTHMDFDSIPRSHLVTTADLVTNDDFVKKDEKVGTRVEDEGIKLNVLLLMIGDTDRHTFSGRQIEEDKRWVEIAGPMINTYEEIIMLNGVHKYYKCVE